MFWMPWIWRCLLLLSSNRLLYWICVLFFPLPPKNMANRSVTFCLLFYFNSPIWLRLLPMRFEGPNFRPFPIVTCGEAWLISMSYTRRFLRCTQERERESSNACKFYHTKRVLLLKSSSTRTTFIPSIDVECQSLVWSKKWASSNGGEQDYLNKNLKRDETHNHSFKQS